MKKLMIAAAAAALIGGAFAECQEDTDCVFAYKVTLTGKSTVAAATKAKASKCIESECYRKVGSYKVQGYIYGTTENTGSAATCDEGCGCNDLGTFESYLWNTKTLKKVGAPTFTLLDLVGSVTASKATTAEVVMTLDDLTLAGFGKYDTKKLLLKSASGYFAGTVDAPKCSDCEYNASDCSETCEETDSAAFAVCTLDAAADASKTPAYGKWTLKYDKSATKKLTKVYDASTVVPAKVISANN